MEGPAVFFYFVLPVLLAAGGWLAVALHARGAAKGHHPAE